MARKTASKTTAPAIPDDEIVYSVVWPTDSWGWARGYLTEDGEGFTEAALGYASAAQAIEHAPIALGRLGEVDAPPEVLRSNPSAPACQEMTRMLEDTPTRVMHPSDLTPAEDAPQTDQDEAATEEQPEAPAPAPESGSDDSTPVQDAQDAQDAPTPAPAEDMTPVEGSVQSPAEDAPPAEQPALPTPRPRNRRRTAKPPKGLEIPAGHVALRLAEMLARHIAENAQAYSAPLATEAVAGATIRRAGKGATYYTVLPRAQAEAIRDRLALSLHQGKDTDLPMPIERFRVERGLRMIVEDLDDAQ